MKTKPFSLLLLLFIFSNLLVQAQNKYEREYRILKSQFPDKAYQLIQEKLTDVKRLKFYKETDSAKTSFEAKFKKDKLWYSVEFNADGILEDVEIIIEPVDIPEDAFDAITYFLDTEFSKYRLKKIQQQYPVPPGENEANTIKNAFQNLILPSINYECIVAGKKDKGYLEYEILFDARGTFKKMRQSLPPNYDHVLY